MPDRAPTGVSTPSYQLVPQGPSFSQPAAPVRPSFPSAGYRDSSARQNPAGSLQPGTAPQPGPSGKTLVFTVILQSCLISGLWSSHGAWCNAQLDELKFLLHSCSDMSWTVSPLSLFPGGEEMSTDSHGVGFGAPENVSPPIPPPGPVYQAGSLSHYEATSEDGDYMTQTEEQGFLPPPPPLPMSASAGQDFAPHRSEPERWGPYPYYDYMFLTGQYPPGTVTYASQSNEQGRDSWQDVHYVRDYISYNPGPMDQVETSTGAFSAPQTFAAPIQPVQGPAVAGYGPGGAQPALQPASGNFMQPGRFAAPTRSHAGGYYLGKVC